ncbi:hypothetical protein OG777_04545 [Micromonospora peucetia]|uniref:Uncharacterized protein n=1 Tax=Micromonospora peucetia TaxID=47871 RepID=A0A1C6U6Z8_9ACTN|nr:hypothetical protein [Micromonospora peucetia]MCX4386195.1 hypothetical protein [Micromonospora peucetia]WSA33547.1 hypothetical protein OIE14_05730 [Micromonospora peucetia]SCL49865.1 hypothetical protein GA0070608_0600 [Micromonospora peucetia]
MSFDLSVWALADGATPEDVRAAVLRCRQGQHVERHPDPRVVAFYRAITNSYPDRPAGPGTPWAVTPLHAANDHVELNLHPTCEDQVLLDIERLAGAYDLMLFDVQDGSVYPPPARLTG